MREVEEETSLVTQERPEFLFHHETANTRHSVYLLSETTGIIKLQRSELTDAVWWDGNGTLNLSHSTRDILSRADLVGAA